jgi:hypothetical protein
VPVFVSVALPGSPCASLLNRRSDLIGAQVRVAQDGGGQRLLAPMVVRAPAGGTTGVAHCTTPIISAPCYPELCALLLEDGESLLRLR